MEKKIKIFLNEETYFTEKSNIEELLLELKLNPKLVIININGQTIENLSQIINENDKIDIFLLVDGG